MSKLVLTATKLRQPIREIDETKCKSRYFGLDEVSIHKELTDPDRFEDNDTSHAAWPVISLPTTQATKMFNTFSSEIQLIGRF